MKRLNLAIVAGALLALAAAAAPAQAASPSTTFQRGPGAEAFFTTVPETGPVPGEQYQDVRVFASNQISSDSRHTPVPFATVDVFTYTVDDQGNQVMVSDIFGGGSAPDVPVTVRIDKKFRTASVQATLPFKIVTPENPGGSFYGEGSVDVSWTAYGPLVRFSTFQKTVFPGQAVYLSHDRGRAREASASGDILGTSYSGATGTVGTDYIRETLVTH